MTVRAQDGQGSTAEAAVTVTKGTGGGPGDCNVVVDLPDGGVPGDGAVPGDGGPGTDGGPRPDGATGSDGGPGGDGGGDGCGCQSTAPGAGPGLLVVLALGIGLARRRRGLGLVVALTVGLGAAACGPSDGGPDDASMHDATFHQDAALDAAVDAAPLPDGAIPDAGPDAGDECAVAPVPAGRTGTTVYLYDGNGDESAEPIEVGTEITVGVEITVETAPPGSIGFLVLDLRNLTLDASSFELDGAPLALPEPFIGRIPLTLAAGSYEVTFRATVSSDTQTVEVDAWLGFGSGAACRLDRSHSLAVLQVIGGFRKGETCYDLDQAQSVQVAPYTPLQSTQRYRDENGEWSDVLIDDLVVGSTCPGPGVMVHQIEKCFTRSASTTISLSGAAYGGDDWLVDDIFLVEVLSYPAGDVIVAATTYQVATQVLGCCLSLPCTSSLEYPSGGPVVAIENRVQGGGNNGAIAAGAFDISDLLPSDGSEFSLRVTALDQGVEGRLDRVFLNVAFP